MPRVQDYLASFDPAVTGYPDDFSSALGVAYDGDIADATSGANAAVELANQEKLALTAQIEELKQANLVLGAANYQLLLATSGDGSVTDEVPEDDEPDEGPTADDLFNDSKDDK